MDKALARKRARSAGRPGSRSEQEQLLPNQQHSDFAPELLLESISVRGPVIESWFSCHPPGCLKRDNDPRLSLLIHLNSKGCATPASLQDAEFNSVCKTKTTQCPRWPQASPREAGAFCPRLIENYTLCFIRDLVYPKTLKPLLNGGVAQLVEHLLCKQGVIGSNPFTSTIQINQACASGLFLCLQLKPQAPSPPLGVTGSTARSTFRKQ